MKFERPRSFGQFKTISNNQLPSKPKVDRSDYIASITTLNGCNNGGPGSYYLDANEETRHFHETGPNSTFLANAWVKIKKLWIITQNLLSPSLTKNQIQENIRKVIKVISKSDKTKLYQLGP